MAVASDIKLQIKQQIRDQIAETVAKQKTLGRFGTNLKEDVSGFAKGLLGLGLEAVLHPIESSASVFSTAAELAGETIKNVPAFAQEVGATLLHPVERIKLLKLKDEFSKLRAIPYEQQTKLLDEMTRQAIPAEGTPGQKIIGAVGGSLLGSTLQEITHPAEFAYNKPFTFGLDLLSVGGGKALGKITTPLAETVRTSKAGRVFTELFVPEGKLVAAGFPDVADDIARTNERIYSAQNNIIKNTAETFEKRFDLNGAEREEFFTTIDALRRAEKSVKATSENPKIQSAINWWLDEEVPKLQKASGLPDDRAITNYLHHYFPEKIKAAEKSLTPLKIKEGYLKKSEDVTGFSTDPVVSISAIKSKIATNALKDSFLERTFKKYGLSKEQVRARLADDVGEETVLDLEKKGTLDATAEKRLDIQFFSPKKNEGMYLPKPLAEKLEEYYGAKAKSTTDKLLTPLEFFNRNWKPLATAVRPRFHVRNIVGNLYNSIVVGSMNPARLPVAAKLQLSNYINGLRVSSSPAGNIAKRLFPTPLNEKLFQQAAEDGVIGRGFFAMDLHDLSKAAQSSEDIIKQINRVQTPAEIYRIPVLKQYLNLSHSIGQAIEDNARLSLYLDRLRKGDSRIAARAYVDKHLFDYLTGLGDADKIIKKIIPFWSWTRFNLPLQVSSFIKQPLRQEVIQRLGGAYVEQKEAADPSVQFMTQEERDQGFLKIGSVEYKGKVLDKYIRTQAVLPQADLVNLVDLFRLEFRGNFTNPLADLRSRLSRNEDYFGKQIERFTGERKKFLGGSFTGQQKEILQILPFLSELNKAIGGGFAEGEAPPLPVRLEQVLSPLAVTLRDPEEVKFFGLLEKEKELTGTYEGGLVSLYKRYMVLSGKNPEEKVYQQNVRQLEQLLKEKGITDITLLQYKIKAMQTAIKDKVKEQVQREIKAHQQAFTEGRLSKPTEP